MDQSQGELQPFLLECFEAADDGAEYVIERNRPPVLKTGGGWSHANLRTRFAKIIRRAGLEQWPRLWHNLRASRQTELADQFPSHVVCAWIGNSESVAREHYLQVTPEHIAKAIASRPLTGVMPQVMPHGVASCGTESQVTIAADEEDGHNSVQRNKKRPHAKTCDRSIVEDRGLESEFTNRCGGNTLRIQSTKSESRAAAGAAIASRNARPDAQLQWLIERWEAMSPTTRDQIIHLATVASASHERPW